MIFKCKREDVVIDKSGPFPSISSERIHKLLNESMKFAVVAIKMLGRNIRYTDLRDKVVSLWKLDESVQLTDLEGNCFIAKLSNEKDYQEILLGDPWVIFGHYLTVQPWTLEFYPHSQFASQVMAWIRIPGLPAKYYKKSVIRAIGEVLGKVIRIDYNTVLGERGKFAGMAVLIDLSQPLTSKIRVHQHTLFVEYEGLPTICYCYGRYGHLEHVCPRKQGTKWRFRLHHPEHAVPSETNRIMLAKSVLYVYNSLLCHADRLSFLIAFIMLHSNRETQNSSCGNQTLIIEFEEVGRTNPCNSTGEGNCCCHEGIYSVWNVEAKKQVKFFHGCVASAFAERDHAIMEPEKAKEKEDSMSQLINPIQKRVEELTSDCLRLKKPNDDLQIDMAKLAEQNETFKMTSSQCQSTCSLLPPHRLHPPTVPLHAIEAFTSNGKFSVTSAYEALEEDNWSKLLTNSQRVRRNLTLEAACELSDHGYEDMHQPCSSSMPNCSYVLEATSPRTPQLFRQFLNQLIKE
ncbi:hypothetical protein K1719_028481 [Acacia pycnantha]|nr:hypothetical protein K1719_028481 [Acacia pycnantha]